jgi:ParB family chromosome partitioning protein
MRKIRYKEPTENLNKMAAPVHNGNNRASIGMDKFVGEFYYISLEKLIPFKNQARSSFNEVELNQLAETIKEHGVRQPLSVVKSEEHDGKYEVISGERRLRASKIAGLEKVPCIILDSSANKDEVALVENIQRADLHPIELARGLKKLIDNYGWGGQTEIEKRLGISTSRVSEAVKLLDLSEEVQTLAIDKNFTGRENLQGLLKLGNDEERFAKILGVTSSLKKTPTSFSVLRVSFSNEEFNIQKGSLKKLSDAQKKELKKKLLSIVEELN